MCLLFHSYSMVQSQMERDRFRNVSNLFLVEPNWIRDSIYAFIRLLFANFVDAQNVAYMHSLFDDARYSPDASSNVNYFLIVADVKRDLCAINKNNRANATHGLSLLRKMFWDWTEAMLVWRDPRPGCRPVLTLRVRQNQFSQPGTCFKTTYILRTCPSETSNADWRLDQMAHGVH